MCIRDRLRPVFHVKGTVTAGNSSQTSDGAAVVLVMEREEALRLGLKPLVRFVGFAVGGVPPEVMGIGPIAAIPKVLKLTGLNLGDIDLIELNLSLIHIRRRRRPIKYRPGWSPKK